MKKMKFKIIEKDGHDFRYPEGEYAESLGLDTLSKVEQYAFCTNCGMRYDYYLKNKYKCEEAI